MVIGENVFPSLVASLPVLCLALGGIVLMLVDTLGIFKRELVQTTISYVAIFSAICFLMPMEILNGVFLSRQVSADSFTTFFSVIILLSAFAVVTINYGSIRAQGVERFKDINALLLFSTAGALALVSANDLLTSFLSIELLSIPVYVLAGSAYFEKSSTEGSLKYFILGAVSSAVLLYGLALIYATTGTLDIQQINSFLLAAQHSPSPLLLIGVALVIFGFGFKLSLAPFHFWTADAYQGAPLGITAFMAVVVKAAAFGGIVRIFSGALPVIAGEFKGFFIVLGVASMFLGNLSALRQKSIKRFIAYSSIAHAGYAIIALALVGGTSALLSYVLFYSLTSIGMFAILVGHLGGTKYQFEKDDLSALKGMYARDPMSALLFAIFILSLAGIPPLAGFFAKFYILTALLKEHSGGIAVIVVLNSAISLFYYLKVMALAFESGEKETREEFSAIPSRFIALASGVLVLSSVFILDFVTQRSEAAVQSICWNTPQSVKADISVTPR